MEKGERCACGDSQPIHACLSLSVSVPACAFMCVKRTRKGCSRMVRWRGSIWFRIAVWVRYLVSVFARILHYPPPPHNRHPTPSPRTSSILCVCVRVSWNSAAFGVGDTFPGLSLCRSLSMRVVYAHGEWGGASSPLSLPCAPPSPSCVCVCMQHLFTVRLSPLPFSFVL